MPKLRWTMMAVLFMSLAPGFVAQDQPPIDEEKLVDAVRALPRTDAGEWDGTWFYLSRNEKMVLWLRTENGKTEARIRYQSKITPEYFETDWNGQIEYYVAGRPSAFAFTLDDWDENTLRGTWKWDSPVPQMPRSESGRFIMYRGGRGRDLVIVFEEFLRIRSKGGRKTRFQQPASWSFRKVSKRLALWEEVTN